MHNGDEVSSSATMGAMGGPHGKVGATVTTPRKDVNAGIPSSAMKPAPGAAPPRRARKPMNLTVDVENLDGGPPSPIEKHIMVDVASTKPRRNSSSSTFLQPDQFMSELKVVKTGTPNLSVSDSPKSARSVRSIRASFETPRNEAVVWASPHNFRNSPKPFEWSNGNGDEAQYSRRSRSVVSQNSEFETFYDSLPTLEPPESPKLESQRWDDHPLPMLELPKLELSYEGKPAPAPAHLRTRPAITLWDPEAAELHKLSSSKGVSSALQKLQANSALLGNSSAPGNNMRPGEKMRSASSRKSESVTASTVDTVISSHSQPLNPSTFDVEETKNHVKPVGLLRRMLHWGASKFGKKTSGNSKNGGKDISSKPDAKIAATVAANVEAATDEGKVEEVTGVANLDPDSPRSSVSSVHSEVSAKSKHKRQVKSEMVKSKLWLLRVNQKLQQGRPASNNKESGDESDGNVFPATVRGATFHGYPSSDAASSTSKPVDKKMLTASARFNPERSAISKLVGTKHRRNSTWDAGKLSPMDVFTEHLFSPKQKLPKSDAHGLLTPPRPLTGDTTDFTRRRRPTSLTTDAGYISSGYVSSPSPSPRRTPRPVNPTRDHQAEDSRQTLSKGSNPCRQGGVPLPTAPTTGTFLQTAALILASPGNKDEPNAQLFENSRKSAASPNQNSQVTTPPISPNSQPRTGFGGFKGFNSPLPLPIRVTTNSQGSGPTSPVYPASSPGNRFTKSPARDSSTPTSPRLFNAPTSSAWSGMQNSPSSPGIFAPSPGWVEMQSSTPRGAGQFQTSQITPGNKLYHARSHGSLAGEQLLLEDISFTNLVKRGDATVPRNGVTGGVTKPTVSENSVTTPPRPFSFEQIVAGRNRSPPTDNTLMKFFFKCREIDHLNKFLGVQKKRFLESFNADNNSEKCFHMILSEAGQGLSSMISTLCTAWLLENTIASASVKWHPIPVMNMCQKEMWQHRDAAWLFHVCGIEPSVLLFIDEVSLTPETVVAGRVKRAVTGQDILQTKDEVASSCTIVSEKFRQEAPKLLQARYMKTLLLAGILVDTKNLSTGSSRDKQQATILLVGAGSLGRNGFYKHLVNIRDENYVTTFIKEIYGDSNALTVEQPAPREPGVEAQYKPMSRPTSIITPEVPPKPPPKASHKSEPELKLCNKSAPKTKLGRKSYQPEVKNKVPLNKRGWFRNRPSVQ